jgi:hypothetical protein
MKKSPKHGQKPCAGQGRASGGKPSKKRPKGFSSLQALVGLFRYFVPASGRLTFYQVVMHLSGVGLLAVRSLLDGFEDGGRFISGFIEVV